MPQLRIENLDFAYGAAPNRPFVLKGLNLDIPAGQFLSLAGPSGSGKSTLLYLIAGLRRPAGGRIFLDGRPLTGPGVDRSVVFQQYSLFPWLTARENVAFGLRQANKKLSKQASLEQAVAFLQQVGMGRDDRKYPAELSGGMQQRVAIARALAMDAAILLLDEPFGALDTRMRQELQELLEAVWCARRRTVLFITHDIEEAVLLGDRVVFLNQGRIAGDMPVKLPRPRRREELANTQEYSRLCQELRRLFYGREGEGQEALSV